MPTPILMSKWQPMPPMQLVRLRLFNLKLQVQSMPPPTSHQHCFAPMLMPVEPSKLAPSFPTYAITVPQSHECIPCCSFSLSLISLAHSTWRFVPITEVIPVTWAVIAFPLFLLSLTSLTHSPQRFLLIPEVIPVTWTIIQEDTSRRCWRRWQETC